MGGQAEEENLIRTEIDYNNTGWKFELKGKCKKGEECGFSHCKDNNDATCRAL